MTLQQNVIPHVVIEGQDIAVAGRASTLAQRWDQLESAGYAIAESETGAPSLPNQVHVLQDQVATISAALVREQFDVLARLASCRALDLHDVIAKLGVWMSLVCPEPADQQHLQPADRLVISVYDDLRRLSE